MQGPQEDFSNKWRTTSTHTPSDMMAIYREIFFAGFPTPVDSKGNGRVAFPSTLVQQYFEKFGVVTFFKFDERRGIGCVVFADGDVAEECYLATHLCRFNSNSTVGQRGGGGGSDRDFSTMMEQEPLLFLEFAQYLPFVNPIMFDVELGVTGINRQLLRTFPIRDRLAKLNLVAGVHVVLGEGKHVQDPSSVALLGGSVADFTVVRAMVALLAPSCAPAVQTVTLLDLWHGFFTDYVVKKTCPDVSKIHHPLLIFASKPSPYQELRGAIAREAATQAPSGSVFSQRLGVDDEFRCCVAYLCLKQLFLHDPAMMSFLRDVSSQAEIYRKKARQLLLAGGAPEQQQKPQEEPFANQIFSTNADFHVLDNAQATRYLLSCTIGDMALRALANAHWLHQRSPAMYPKDGLELVVEIIARYASSGSAHSIASVCATVEDFSSPGGLGAAALTTWQSMLWRSVKGPLALILVVILGATFTVIYLAG